MIKKYLEMPLSSKESDMKEVLRLRGLPWSATPEDIIKWLGDDVKVKGGEKGVHLTMSREGRPSGEAYIAVESEEDIEAGIKKDQEHMGHRYIEVFRSDLSEMGWKLLKSTEGLDVNNSESCVRLRGLPYDCTKEEVIQFFRGMEIVPNGISLMTDFQGRSTGEAYVQFINRATAERALDKHKEKIGHRWIEIFRSTVAEKDQAVGKIRPMFGGSRPGPYDRLSGPQSRFGGMGPGGSRGGRMMGPGMGGGGRGDWGDSDFGGPNSMGFSGGPRNQGGGGGGNFAGTGHRVHMRGIPFQAVEEDIADFFRPLTPVNIKILIDNQGRASGEADVDFARHDDALAAMKKDKENMHHRYIELFLDSTPDGGGPMGDGPGFGRNFGSGMGGGGFGRSGGMDNFDEFDRGDRFGSSGGGNRFGGDGNRFGGDGGGFGGGDRFGDGFGSGGGGRFGGGPDRYGGGGNQFGSDDNDRFGGGGNARMGPGMNSGGGFNQRGNFNDSGRDFPSGKFGRGGNSGFGGGNDYNNGGGMNDGFRSGSYGDGPNSRGNFGPDRNNWNSGNTGRSSWGGGNSGNSWGGSMQNSGSRW